MEIYEIYGIINWNIWDMNEYKYPIWNFRLDIWFGLVFRLSFIRLEIRN